MASNRFLIVPEDSSAARMPRPGATMASATLLSSARFMCSLHLSVSPARGGDIASFYPQHLDPRQDLALEPFEEGATGGRDVGEAIGNACGIERRDRVAAACDRNKLPGGREFRRRLGDLDCAGIK